MSTIFTPIEGDALAPALPTVQVAMVKQSSGFLTPYGFGPDALAGALADAESRGGRVVVTRTVGETDWEVVGDDVVIPDALPDDFQ